MTDHHAKIFAEGDYEDGTLEWGWHCTCGMEAQGFQSAHGAGEEARAHEVMP